MVLVAHVSIIQSGNARCCPSVSSPGLPVAAHLMEFPFLQLPYTHLQDNVLAFYFPVLLASHHCHACIILPHYYFQPSSRHIWRSYCGSHYHFRAIRRLNQHLSWAGTVYIVYTSKSSLYGIVVLFTPTTCILLQPNYIRQTFYFISPSQLYTNN